MDIASTVVCTHILGVPPTAYTQDKCPRCKGTGIYYGVAVDGSSGDVETVTGVNELMQQLQKIFLTRRRPSGYGFDYSLLTKVSPAALAAIKAEVQRCISYLQQLQQDSARRGYYTPTDARIAGIYYLQVGADSTDPRRVNISVGVMTQSALKLPPVLLSLQNRAR